MLTIVVLGEKNKVMTATIWHRHDRLKNNEEGFFSYSKLPIFICHTICRCMKCESRSSRYYVIDVGAKKLTQQCYAGKLTPLDDSNTRVENSSWHCLKITTKCLITIYERSELRLLLDVEITTTMPRLWITALKSPLRYLYFIDFSVEVSHYFGSVEDYSFNPLISVVALLFFQLCVITSMCMGDYQSMSSPWNVSRALN